MLKRPILILLSLISLAFSSWALAAPSMALASTPQQEVCKGVGAGSGTGNCTSSISLTTVVRNVINIFSIIIGIAAVVMIMVGGFKYITAAGDTSNVTAAKHTIVYAVIGLVVAALAQFIVWFVLDNV